eukprot:Opistho-1_new@970
MRTAFSRVRRLMRSHSPWTGDRPKWRRSFFRRQRTSRGSRSSRGMRVTCFPRSPSTASRAPSAYVTGRTCTMPCLRTRLSVRRHSRARPSSGPSVRISFGTPLRRERALGSRVRSLGLRCSASFFGETCSHPGWSSAGHSRRWRHRQTPWRDSICATVRTHGTAGLCLRSAGARGRSRSRWRCVRTRTTRRSRGRPRRIWTARLWWTRTPTRSPCRTSSSGSKGTSPHSPAEHPLRCPDLTVRCSTHTHMPPQPPQPLSAPLRPQSTPRPAREHMRRTIAQVPRTRGTSPRRLLTSITPCA